MVTLKSLAAASGALHSREEFETIIEPGTAVQPDSWPAGDAATFAQRIGRGEPLELLFELRQERQTAHDSFILATAIPAVELSLGQGGVCWNQRGVLRSWRPRRRLPGQADLLARLHDVLTGEWALEPQPLSKFERALELCRPDVFALLAVNEFTA